MHEGTPHRNYLSSSTTMTTLFSASLPRWRIYPTWLLGETDRGCERGQDQDRRAEFDEFTSTRSSVLRERAPSAISWAASVP
jgi:hypothetical protein